MDALTLHRLHFAFTITFHYLFPQLTMGLALLILILKTMALRTGNPHYNRAARFWGKIFAINFAMGVVTGIPMEFQFGTHWARFSAATGGVIGQLLAMEGVFAFVLESSLLGAFLYGERYLSRWPFRAVVGQRDGVPRKPDPAGALEIADRLGIDPGAFVYVGDSGVDMETARSAGMFSVGVSWGFRPVEELRVAGARAIIDHPSELLGLIERNGFEVGRDEDGRLFMRRKGLDWPPQPRIRELRRSHS